MNIKHSVKVEALKLGGCICLLLLALVFLHLVSPPEGKRPIAGLISVCVTVFGPLTWGLAAEGSKKALYSKLAIACLLLGELFAWWCFLK